MKFIVTLVRARIFFLLLLSIEALASDIAWKEPEPLFDFEVEWRSLELFATKGCHCEVDICKKRDSYRILSEVTIGSVDLLYIWNEIEIMKDLPSGKEEIGGYELGGGVLVRRTGPSCYTYIGSGSQSYDIDHDFPYISDAAKRAILDNAIKRLIMRFGSKEKMTEKINSSERCDWYGKYELEVLAENGVKVQCKKLAIDEKVPDV